MFSRLHTTSYKGLRLSFDESGSWKRSESSLTEQDFNYARIEENSEKGNSNQYEAE